MSARRLINSVQEVTMMIGDDRCWSQQVSHLVKTKMVETEPMWWIVSWIQSFNNISNNYTSSNPFHEKKQVNTNTYIYNQPNASNIIAMKYHFSLCLGHGIFDPLWYSAIQSSRSITPSQPSGHESNSLSFWGKRNWILATAFLQVGLAVGYSLSRIKKHLIQKSRNCYNIESANESWFAMNLWTYQLMKEVIHLWYCDDNEAASLHYPVTWQSQGENVKLIMWESNAFKQIKPALWYWFMQEQVNDKCVCLTKACSAMP